MATDSPRAPELLSDPEPEQRPHPSDQELMELLRLGDQLAVAQLYDRHSALVFSVARHVLLDEYAAEDVTQEIFLQLWRNPASFNPARGSLKTWLTVVSRHRAIDRCRKKRAEVDVSDVVIPIDSKQFREAHQRQESERLGHLMAEMPNHLRAALQMAYFEGLTHSEISARTGDPLGTVKSRIRIGLEWIRRRMEGIQAKSHQL